MTPEQIAELRRQVAANDAWCAHCEGCVDCADGDACEAGTLLVESIHLRPIFDALPELLDAAEERDALRAERDKAQCAADILKSVRFVLDYTDETKDVISYAMQLRPEIARLRSGNDAMRARVRALEAGLREATEIGEALALGDEALEPWRALLAESAPKEAPCSP